MKSLEDRIKDLENERNNEKQVEILQEIGKLWMYVFPREIAVMPVLDADGLAAYVTLLRRSCQAMVRPRS